MLRKEINLSQKELADKLELNKSQITSYELGDRTPPIDNLIKIANFFNVSLDFLVGLNDEEISKEIELNNLKYRPLKYKGENLSEKDKKKLFELIEVFMK